MGLSVDTSTLETFLFYGLLFCVTMGYYVYRLSSKILDHVIHTRQVDQYVSHFENNQDVFEAVGSGLMNFGNDIISKFYTFNCVRYGCDSAKSFLGPLARFFFSNRAASNSHTFYTGLADRFCNLVKKVTSPKSTTPSRCPIFNDKYRRTDRMCPVAFPVDFDFVCAPAPETVAVPEPSPRVVVGPWQNSTIFSDAPMPALVTDAPTPVTDAPAPPTDCATACTGSNLTRDQIKIRIDAMVNEITDELRLYGAPQHMIEIVEKLGSLDFYNTDQEQLGKYIMAQCTLSSDEITEINEWSNKYASIESNPHPIRKMLTHSLTLKDHMGSRDEFLKYVEMYFELAHDAAVFVLKKRKLSTSSLEVQIRKVMEELKNSAQFNSILDMFFPINPPSIEEQMLERFRVLENTIVDTTQSNDLDVPLTMGGEGSSQPACWCTPDCCGPDGIPCGSVPCPCGPDSSLRGPYVVQSRTEQIEPELLSRLMGTHSSVVVTDEGVVITEDQ